MIKNTFCWHLLPPVFAEDLLSDPTCVHKMPITTTNKMTFVMSFRPLYFHEQIWSEFVDNGSLYLSV